MQTDFSGVIRQLTKLVPDYAEVSIIPFEQPTCSTASYENESPIFYQIYIAFPLKAKTAISRPNNVFSLSHRLETIERSPEAWQLTVTSMLNEESARRAFINRRVQQARRQQWLYGNDVRIDGKESNRDHVPPRQRGFIF